MSLSMLTLVLLSATPLMEARKDFSTTLDGVHGTAPLPSVKGLKPVKFPSGDLKLSAFIAKPASKAQRLPAIVWLTGGLPCCGLDDETWNGRPRDNDQSARQFLEAGLVMMFPTMRGAYGNPGVLDSYWGEVDDVLAAIEWLKKQPNIDPQRIWLGGHSSGATLAVLAAEAGAQVQGVIAFGAAAEVCDYGQSRLHFAVSAARECELRSPVKWLSTVETPMWFIAGALDDSYAFNKLRGAARGATNRHFFSIVGASHFDALAPVNEVIARRLAAGQTPLADDAEAQRAFDATPRQTVKHPDGWSFELPADFEKIELKEKTSGLVYERGVVRIFINEPHDKLLDQAHPCFPPGVPGTAIHQKWQGFELCGARPTAANTPPMRFVQVPLSPDAVIVGVAWPAATDEMVEALLQRVLDGVRGPTNWK